eukprot:11582-Pleurochrysis_carterae.AAC.1
MKGVKDMAIREAWVAFIHAHTTLFGDGSRAFRRMMCNFQEYMEELDDLSSYKNHLDREWQIS